MPETEISEATLHLLECFANRHDISIVEAVRFCILFAAETQAAGCIAIQHVDGQIHFRVRCNPLPVHGIL